MVHLEAGEAVATVRADARLRRENLRARRLAHVANLATPGEEVKCLSP
jgi:hypothetical protein